MAYDGMDDAMTNQANKQSGLLRRFELTGAAIVAACLAAGATFLGYGVDANLPWPVTSNTTIAPTHCMGTILAGTGSTPQITLTLPAVTGFPSNCSVLVKNGNGRSFNGTILSGFPADLNPILFPTQSVGVKIVNGAWQAFYNPGRWSLTSSPTIYVNGNSGATSNTTATGNNTLNFASTPASFTNGATITDVTTPAAIPPGTTISSTTGTTVVMSANAAAPGVGNGDMIAVSAVCGYTGTSACSPGNDTNDGLSPSSPLLTPTKAIFNLFSYINANGKSPSINLAHGLNPGFLCAQGPVVGNAAFSITGDNNSINAVKISGAVSVKDYCFVSLKSLEVDGGTQSDVNCDFYGGIDLRSVTLGPTTASGASADHGCQINFIGQDGSAATNSIQIGTGANDVLQTYRGGHISLASPTNIPSNITVATAFYFTEGGYIDGLTGTPFTGAGVVTGPKCSIADTSSGFDGNPNTFLPGTSNCPYPFLPNPSASTLGGIESIAAIAHQWIDSISTSGVPHQSQPATSDLSDVTAPTAWTATDGSGAGLTFTTNAETRYVKNGKVCVVSFMIQWPSTSDTNTAQVNGIPAACTAHSGTYSWVAGGAALTGLSSIGGGIAWVSLQAGGASLFFFGNANPLTNANMSGGIIRGTITYITN
jgi:hypothetical protein